MCHAPTSIDHDSHQPGLPRLTHLTRSGASAPLPGTHPRRCRCLSGTSRACAQPASWVVWTVDDPARLRALLALGVDGIIANRPDVLRGCLSNQRQAAEPPGVGRIG